MKMPNLDRFTVAFFLLGVMSLFFSCVDNGNAKEADQSHSVPSLSGSLSTQLDSTLRLTFTSGIRAILEDRKGNIWFGSHQQGVCLYDGKQMRYFTVADGLSQNQVRSIYEDSDGNIWFECGVGLSYYDGEKIINPGFRNYALKHFWESGEQDLWFKGDEGIGYNTQEGAAGVYRYDGNALTYHVFPVESDSDSKNYYSVSTPFVKGKNGQYWFGTYGGVFGYNGTFFTIIDHNSLGMDSESAGMHVRSIYEDSKGNLWIGNNGIGVLHYNGDSTINFSEKMGLISEGSKRSGGFRSPTGSLEHVFSIGEDHSGNIWFGDRDTGAWKYDGRSMKNYTTEDGLTTTYIWQIYAAKNGELWFAMDDGSVCRFNGEKFDRIF